MRKSLLYYVTSHGFGHGVRSVDILRAFIRLRPDVPVRVVSGLPLEFFQHRLGSSGFQHRVASFDVGIVQHDSIRMDLPATIVRLQELRNRRTVDLAAETAFIQSEAAGLVVADIPGLPMAAARAAGIPAVAVGNFSWDWIYDAYRDDDLRWEAFSAQFRVDYACADLLLELPFACDMSAFSRKECVGLLAEPGRNRHDELARELGVNPDAKWVLLAFTALGWDESALRTVESIRGCEFFALQPLGWRRRNIHPVVRERFSFQDVLASCDAVVSKPGYGIVSDCVANRKPLVYADRGEFREFPVLVEGIRRYLSHQYVSAASLYAGDIGGALDAVWRQPAPVERMPGGGADQAAARLSAWF